MTKENKFKKNFIWNIIGVSLYGFVSLFLLIIVKRINGLGLSGVFSYSYSICTLFLYVSMFYNRTYQIANYNSNKSFNQYLSTRLLTTIISLLIIFLFSIISGFDFAKISIIMLLMLFRSIDAVADCFYAFLQEKDSLYQVGISYTLKSIIGVLLFLIVDILLNNIFLSVIALVVVNILFFLLYDLRNFRSLNSNKIKLDFSNTKLIIKESLSIFIFSFLSIFLANVQKYVIVYYASDEIQSIFAMIIMPATVLSLVGYYLINPFINKLNNLYKNNDIKNFKKLSIQLVLSLFGVGFIGLVVCYYLGIPVLNLIYNIDLSEYKDGLLVIILASIFSASCMIISNYLVLFNKNNMQALFYLISSIVAIVICFIDKNNAILSATISYLVSYCINFLLYLCYYFYNLRKCELYEKK